MAADSAPPLIPHESRRQSAIWTAFPSHGDLWGDDLPRAQAEHAAMTHVLAGPAPEREADAERERIVVLVRGAEARRAAAALLGEAAELVDAEFGDIWLRDTGPVFALRGEETVALRPRFNGWGGKYQLPGDAELAPFVAAQADAALDPVDLTIEGGALEFDGEGTVLTTRECLLNPNRNPGLTEEEAERRLKAAFGAEKVLWLDRGLLNDHTDGHIDNVARFLGGGRVLCQTPAGADDPHAKRLDEAFEQLSQMTDARGRRLEVLTIPSPGRVEIDGEPAPASHMNYAIGNRGLAVPVYGGETQAEAVSMLATLFPDRPVFARSARALLTGGGAFHCITQHQPAPPAPARAEEAS